jgi:ribosomal protein S12 methylthiotransferase accessory factor YcaO
MGYQSDSYVYKDRKPEETVAIVRWILEASGIPVELQHVAHCGKVHSFCVKVPGTRILQQGKGVTEAFAMASTFGEMLERRQNGLRFNCIEFDPKSVGEFGFAIDPDETVFARDRLPSLPAAFRRGIFRPDDICVYDF